MMLYLPRPHGFNNQLISVHHGMAAAKKYGHIFVRPLLFEFANGTFGTKDSPRKGYAFDNFFDTATLDTYFEHPSVSYEEFLASCPQVNLVGETNPYLPMFQPMIDRAVRIPKSDANLTTLGCVLILWGSFAGNFGKYDYEKGYQGFSVTQSPDLSAVISHLTFASKYQTCLKTVVSGIDIAIHLRIGVLADKGARDILWKKMSAKRKAIYGKDAFYPSAAHIASRLCPNKKTFVATNDISVIDELQPLVPTVEFLVSDNFPCTKTFTETELSYFEQLVCEHAPYFIGNRFSSWSSEVYNSRIVQGRKSDASFGVVTACMYPLDIDRYMYVNTNSTGTSPVTPRTFANVPYRQDTLQK